MPYHVTVGHTPSFLYTGYTLTEHSFTHLVELRRVLRHLGIDPEHVIIKHAGPPQALCGFYMMPTYDPRAAVERFLDQEIGL